MGIRSDKDYKFNYYYEGSKNKFKDIKPIKSQLTDYNTGLILGFLIGIIIGLIAGALITQYSI